MKGLKALLILSICLFHAPRLSGQNFQTEVDTFVVLSYNVTKTGWDLPLSGSIAFKDPERISFDIECFDSFMCLLYQNGYCFWDGSPFATQAYTSEELGLIDEAHFVKLAEFSNNQFKHTVSFEKEGVIVDLFFGQIVANVLYKNISSKKLILPQQYLFDPPEECIDERNILLLDIVNISRKRCIRRRVKKEIF